MRLLVWLIYPIRSCLTALFTCCVSSLNFFRSTLCSMILSLVSPFATSSFILSLISCSSDVIYADSLTSIAITASVTSFVSIATFNLTNISSVWLMLLISCSSSSPCSLSLLHMPSNFISEYQSFFSESSGLVSQTLFTGDKHFSFSSFSVHQLTIASYYYTILMKRFSTIKWFYNKSIYFFHPLDFDRVSPAHPQETYRTWHLHIIIIIVVIIIIIITIYLT